MILHLSATVPVAKEGDESFIKKQLSLAAEKQGKHIELKDAHFVCRKKSIDARHGKAKLFLQYDVYTQGDLPCQKNTLPVWKNAEDNRTVIIVGSGPAGLFGALTLLEHGIKPVIVERGSDVTERKRDIAKISTLGKVNADSNYCFGEGGAGTFSDGKLYTRSNKRGNINQVLAIFNHFGADEKILTDAHPHIGTDKLPQIVQNIRDFITKCGGVFFFNTSCTDFITQKNSFGTQSIKGIKTRSTQTGQEKELYADAVLLATGHSANDIYELIAKTEPHSLEAKTFAVGVRVEHPREVIDKIQYKDKNARQNLGAAEYRFTSQQDGRGVYSFCMCPGGFVVPSASAPGQIVVNGMSAEKRNSRWSNAAMVVETRPEDIPPQFEKEALALNCPELKGLYYRTYLESLTFKNGQGQKAPAQRLTDFLEKKDSCTLPACSYAPGIVPSRLDTWLPKDIAQRLSKAFYEADKKMKGYVTSEAVLIASETRTSTPVRILRETNTMECVLIKNLYPAGEGSGYAGGIVSSAMDGINACTKIAEKLTSAKA